MNEYNEDNDDLQPLLGAVGPYLHLTTGPTNPVEDDDEPYPADYYDAPDTDFWEDEEQ